MARLVEASRWVVFDVAARSAATGAQVAMALRERLPSATIRSEPGRSPSGDALRPHLLHCRAAFAGASATQTREAISAALRDLEALAATGPQARALVRFRENDSERTAHAA